MRLNDVYLPTPFFPFHDIFMLDLELNIAEQLIVVGDRVLIQPRTQEGETKAGLILPPGVEGGDDAATGYVIKVGPGYAVPKSDDAEPWQNKDEHVKYVPLQARMGDLAIYLRKYAIELRFNDRKYVVVPHNAILLLHRDEGLFE
jgi:co-chaperonin GroES (HSP10)